MNAVAYVQKVTFVNAKENEILFKSQQGEDGLIHGEKSTICSEASNI